MTSIPTNFVVAAFVDGAPSAQGSMRILGGKVAHDSGAKLTTWRDRVGYEVSQELARRFGFGEYQVDDGAFTLSARFVFMRPKSRPRSEHYKPTKPDADKLLRAIGDALTGVVWKDDSQVVAAYTVKLYTADPLKVGAYLKIRKVIQ